MEVLHDFLRDVHFREPWFLLALVAGALALYLALRPSGKLRFSSLRILPVRGHTWRTRTAWVPAALLCAAALSLAVALAGPRVPDSSQRIEREGIAIMMIVDTSSSMRALDLSRPDTELTRLDAVMEVFKDFALGDGGLPGRPDDAIGIVTFAGFADTRCPLTLDHNVLTQVADSIEIVSARNEDGTALGDGLGLAVARLRQSTASSRVAVLLTDGVSNAGEEDPMAAAELAATYGIKVYTVGAGTDGMAPIRVPDFFSGREVLQQVPVEIDEETLQAIAEKTGGRYFRATDSDALRQIYEQIDRLERTVIDDQRFVAYREYYYHFVIIGLILATAGFVAGATTWRRLP